MLVDVQSKVQVTPGVNAPGDGGLDAARVEVVRDVAELETIRADWESLAARALEPNPFYEPWMLLPALRRLAGVEHVEAILVWGAPRAGEDRAPMIGFFPVERINRLKGMPIARFRLWQHLYCFSCTPLVDRECGAECLDALLKFMAEDRRAPRLLELNLVTADGPLQAEILDACLRHDRMVHVVEAFPRAMLRADCDFDAYWQSALSRRRRKEITRLTNRLAERGSVEVETLADSADPTAWIRDFLALESSGWKGEGGTALASRDNDQAYFAEIAAAAHALGRLRLLRLTLDGRPIAMKCNFLAGRGGWAFKIAFDEALAAYSPGVQLEIENVRRVLADPAIAWMDSCAVSNHFMANQLWPERRLMQTSLIAARGGLPELAIAVMPILRWGARRVRAIRGSQGDKR